MTPDALHKRAERQRRREAGYKRVECWLSAEDAAWVKQVAKWVPGEHGNFTVADVVSWCVRSKREESDQ